MGRRTGRKTSIGGQFAPRLTEMLASPAFKVLSLSAHRVLARLEIELGHHAGNDNGKLPLTYDQLVEYGVHRQAIPPAIRECVALGFVEITQAGRAGNAEWRRPTLFRLTYRHSDKAAATDDWRAIEDSDADAIAVAARIGKKQKSSGGIRTKVQDGNRTTNGHFHSTETNPTSHSTETNPTSISRIGDRVGSPPSAGPTKEPAREGGPAQDGPVPLASIADNLLQAAMSRRTGRG